MSARVTVPGLLIAGTDTGVGKTTVACGLLRLARRRGLKLVPFKPAETGRGDGGVPSDARRLCDAASLPGLEPSAVCPFTFAPPVAPSVAARLARTEISLPPLRAAARALLAHGDALLVEGAGGLLTPYGPALTVADLAYDFDMYVLLVAANRLGTINHTALALAEIRRRHLRSAGVLLVATAAEPAPDQPFNAAEIAAATGISPRGILRFCPGASADDVADALAADVDLDGLLPTGVA